MRLVWPLECLAVLTLTFRKHVTEMKVAKRQFRSICKHELREFYDGWTWNVERSENGRIHFHLVVAFKGRVDVRSGFDFASLGEAKAEKELNGYSKRWRELTDRYGSSASEELRRHWAFFRKLSQRSGSDWGRCELVPIISPDSIERYLSAYMDKHVHCRCEADKGTKLHGASEAVRRAWVDCSALPVVPFGEGRQGERLKHLPLRLSARYSLVGGRAWVWQQKVGFLAGKLGFNVEDESAACAEMTACFGRSWSARWAEIFERFTLADMKGEVVYPSGSEWNADHKPVMFERRRSEKNITDRSGVHPAFRAELMRLRGEVMEWRKRTRCARKRAADVVSALPCVPPERSQGLSALVKAAVVSARSGVHLDSSAAWSRWQAEEEKPYEAWKVDGIEGALLTDHWFSDFGLALAAARDVWERGIGIGENGAVAVLGRRGRLVEVVCHVRAGPF